MQSVKYPAEGLCHSSIAQEEANARVLEKKPQEAVGTNGKTNYNYKAVGTNEKTVTVDHNFKQVSMQLSKLDGFKNTEFVAWNATRT